MRFHALYGALMGALLAVVSLTSGCDKKDAATKPAAEKATAEAANTPATEPGEEAANPPAKRPNKAKAVKATAMTLKLTVNGAESTLALSDAIIASRSRESGMAGFSCVAVLRRVTLSDFSIGDDPARKGEFFSAGAEPTDIGVVKPNQPAPARIHYRRAGEQTQSYAAGTLTWNEDLLSGSAEGKGENGDVVTLSWTCEAET